MSTLQERLGEVFPAATRKRGLQADLHRLTGKARPSIANWFNRPERVNSIERSVAEVICAEYFPEISPTWLAEGVGPKYLKEDKKVAAPEDLPPSPKPRVEPPAPPSGFQDNHTLKPEQWELWQAFNILTSSEDKRSLLDRYHALKEISKAELEKAQQAAKSKEKP